MIDAIVLSKKQQDAFDAMVSYYNNPQGHFVFAGFAGSGKSLMVKKLSDYLESEGVQVAKLAFTHKACGVLRKQGIIDAQTIDSFLYYPQIDKNKKWIGRVKKSLNFEKMEELREQNDLIIVDESSMVTKQFFRDLTELDIPIIFVGDPMQLPPVDEKNKEFSIMEKPDIMLTEIHRQAEKNPIIRLSRHIRETGNFDLSCEEGKHIVFLKDTKFSLRDLYLRMRFNITLCWKNQTRFDMNNKIRLCYGFSQPYPEKNEIIMCMEKKILENNEFYKMERYRVLDTKFHAMEVKKPADFIAVDDAKDGLSAEEILNSNEREYEVRWYTLQSVDAVDAKPLNSIRVREDCWEDVKGECRPDVPYLAYFWLGYAATVHRSQGSQFNKVMFIDENPGRYLDRRKLRYTAVTRAIDHITILLEK